MSKIGVVTIAIDNTYNYGNKLQTYAMQAFLKKYGHASVALRYEPEYCKHLHDAPAPKANPLKKMTLQPLSQTADDILRIVKRRRYSQKISQLRQSRINKFKAFATDYVKFSDQLYDADSDMEALDREYDFFVAGSDQVWNPRYEGAYPFYYLDFAAKGKRIAYAPSIVVAEIPEHQKEDIGRWVKGIDFLSVRERSGQELLHREYGLEAKVVCDPVFLLDKADWQAVAQCPEVPEKYFAVYILGKKTAQLKKAIRRLEKKYKLKAVDLYTEDDADSAFVGPREFLGTIQNAQFLVTDSFHGAAMSVIFETPLVSMERGSHYKTTSRVDNLLELTGLKKVSVEDACKDLPGMMAAYQPNRQKFEAFIEESKQYLLNALQNR